MTLSDILATILNAIRRKPVVNPPTVSPPAPHPVPPLPAPGRLIPTPAPSPLPTPSPSPPSPPGPPVNLADAANLVPLNNLHQSLGLPIIKFDPAMQAISMANNAAQNARNAEGHFVTPGSNGNAGYAWGQCAGEGVYSPQQAIDQFKGDTAHYRIITDAGYAWGGLALDLTTGRSTLTVRGA